MNDWTGNDEVTTTAGSIWLAQRQAYNAGQQDMKERIVKALSDAVASLESKYPHSASVVSIVAESIEKDIK